VSEYIASNEIRIESVAPDWGLRILDPASQPLVPFMTWSSISPRGRVALREFFQKERDDELGRWRWPENPDYVVYIAPECADYDVRITCETSGDSMVYTRSEDYGQNRDHPWESLWARAARAYFDAHPEPKPWHDAEVGEVWLLTVDGDEMPAVVCADTVGTFGGVKFATSLRGWFGRDASAITAGSRVWPEATS